MYFNYLGVDGINVNLNFDSNGKEIDIIRSWGGESNPISTMLGNDIPNVEKVVISAENGNQYLFKNMAGLYYALEFAAEVFSNENYYYEESKVGTFTFVSAQKQFLKSGLNNKPRIGMLIEGSYWYNEAVSYGTVERVSNTYPLFNTQKDFRFMPIYLLKRKSEDYRRELRKRNKARGLFLSAIYSGRKIHHKYRNTSGNNRVFTEQTIKI